MTFASVTTDDNHRRPVALLATALEARAATMVTFDHNLRDVASAQGLFIAPASAL
jgi:predicted nucleic acid-binding protein